VVKALSEAEIQRQRWLTSPSIPPSENIETFLHHNEQLSHTPLEVLRQQILVQLQLPATQQAMDLCQHLPRMTRNETRVNFVEKRSDQLPLYLPSLHRSHLVKKGPQAREENKVEPANMLIHLPLKELQSKHPPCLSSLKMTMNIGIFLDKVHDDLYSSR